MDMRCLVIDLKLRAEFSEEQAPYVVKVSNTSQIAPYLEGDIAHITSSDDTVHHLNSRFGGITLHTNANDSIDGDVLLCFPQRGIAQRIFRRASKHNSILFTERCDQLCVMCSQPPKNKDFRWMFPHYEKAILLLDQGTMIGISGGEPTLYKDELFAILERVTIKRPDISFHILSNGQHFTVEDTDRLVKLHDSTTIVWGVPLYSHNQETHDEIVGKRGAFNKLLENLFILGSTKARIELRTVITKPNYLDIPHLANFIAKHIPFIMDWAVMGMEPIGYAKANKDQLFIDHTAHPKPLISAIEISNALGVPCHLYNVPFCTMPEAWRDRCVDSIADWKKKYLPACDACTIKKSCSGFFEWYDDDWKWSGIQPITS